MTFLSEVFNDEDKNIEIKTKQFLKRLKYCVSKSFKKIRLTKSKQNKELETLFNKRRILKTKKDECSAEELKLVENKLADLCADPPPGQVRGKESTRGLLRWDMARRPPIHSEVQWGLYATAYTQAHVRKQGYTSEIY